MAEKKKYLRRVGLLVTIATAIFVAAIIVVGREQNIFKSTIHITTYFKDVKGLEIGNNIRFTGIRVGTVVEMYIISDTAVEVGMSIESDVAHFIRKNSIATIGNEGLMGNKILILLPGTQNAPSISEDDVLSSVEPIEIDDIMKEINASSIKINTVSSNLIGITEKINRGDGIFGKIFTDTTFTKNLDRTSQNASIITSNLIDLSEKVNSGAGILGKLLTDTTYSLGIDSTTQSLNRVSQNLENITDKINQGEGIFGRLFTDTSLTNNLYMTSKNLEASTYNLYELTEKINTEGNLIQSLVSDTSFSDSLEVLMLRLNEGIKKATEASEAIKNSGLIRLFSKDPEKKETEEPQQEK